ncbi:MAG: methylated-DNA--[protein]-cysteine S-methyltransferase [Hymenobacteraceae bacterium]|nr:methylated-DNA--[protein]-cysteine S-methyltransferase [Hymenobacteraceae bacterium]
MMAHSYCIDSLIGPLCLIADDDSLREIRFAPLGTALDPTPPTSLLAEAARQLTDYFRGARRGFDLPLDPVGTPFQQRVWAELRAIPYGVTTTYSAIARRLGDALAVRAVGRANATNPLALVVPCHRVIGTGGKLTGFAGGLATKEWLLRHEARRTVPNGLFAQPSETGPASAPLPGA